MFQITKDKNCTEQVPGHWKQHVEQPGKQATGQQVAANQPGYQALITNRANVTNRAMGDPTGDMLVPRFRFVIGPGGNGGVQAPLTGMEQKAIKKQRQVAANQPGNRAIRSNWANLERFLFKFI